MLSDAHSALHTELKPTAHLITRNGTVSHYCLCRQILHARVQGEAWSIDAWHLKTDCQEIDKQYCLRMRVYCFTFDSNCANHSRSMSRGEPFIEGNWKKKCLLNQTGQLYTYARGTTDRNQLRKVQANRRYIVLDTMGTLLKTTGNFGRIARRQKLQGLPDRVPRITMLNPTPNLQTASTRI